MGRLLRCIVPLYIAKMNVRMIAVQRVGDVASVECKFAVLIECLLLLSCTCTVRMKQITSDILRCSQMTGRRVLHSSSTRPLSLSSDSRSTLLYAQTPHCTLPSGGTWVSRHDWLVPVHKKAPSAELWQPTYTDTDAWPGFVRSVSE